MSPRWWALALLALPVAPAGAASPMTVAKAMTIVSDPLAEPLPKAIPGAVVDYTDTVTNPAGGALNVTGVAFSDAIPATTKLLVADLSTGGSGPVAFGDGSLLGLLGGSGLKYSFKGLSDTSDGLEFSNDNGASWLYVPMADSEGYDSRVTNIRVKPTGTQAINSYFTIRFRVKVK